MVVALESCAAPAWHLRHVFPLSNVGQPVRLMGNYHQIDMIVYLFWCWSTKTREHFILNLFYFASAGGSPIYSQVNKRLRFQCVRFDASVVQLNCECCGKLSISCPPSIWIVYYVWQLTEQRPICDTHTRNSPEWNFVMWTLMCNVNWVELGVFGRIPTIFVFICGKFSIFDCLAGNLKHCILAIDSVIVYRERNR